MFVFRDFKARMKEAMEIHDQFLDKRGPVSTTHRCFPLPFDEKLRRKKKFRFFSFGAINAYLSDNQNL